jgi:hypothetical protein
MIKRIHVNQHVIRANLRNQERDAPISVKTSKGTVRAHSVIVDGPSRLIYAPDRPLACGARLWLETTAPVSARDEMTGEVTELP